jgi:hypothetical protein
MEFIFEILLQFFGEILLQLLFELIAELGLRSLTAPFEKPKNAVLSAIGFALWGAIAGGISLLVFPNSPITSIEFRKVNLILTPLIVGGVMMLIGRERDKRGQILVRLDRFGYAFVFAFTMAVVRFIWTH